jgi:hypothetical protein
LQPLIFFFQSDLDFHFQIAIAIPIKNQSGKIADRILSFNRSSIFPAKSIIDFMVKIGSRLKHRLRTAITVVNRKNRFRQPCLTFYNRSAIFPEKSIPGFIVKSISDFQISIAITIPIKNRSGKIADRFSFQNRIAIFLENSDPDHEKLNKP